MIKFILQCLQWFKDWITTNIYTILYLGLIGILTKYIFCNWEKCISMQFFSRFDGNNILFLVWLLLIILPFYDIEGKGIKVHRKEMKRMEDAEKKIQNKEAEYQLEKLESERENTGPKTKIRVRVSGKL